MMMAVKVLQLRLCQWMPHTFLNYNVRCDLIAERCLQVQRAIDRDTVCYRILYQERNFLQTSYSRKVMRYSPQVLLTALKLAAVQDSTCKHGFNVIVSDGKRTPLYNMSVITWLSHMFSERIMDKSLGLPVCLFSGRLWETPVHWCYWVGWSGGKHWPIVSFHQNARQKP